MEEEGPEEAGHFLQLLIDSGDLMGESGHLRGENAVTPVNAHVYTHTHTHMHTQVCARV